ncbi:MAG: alpha/beta hydrolase [Paracoccaceae bacterium]
MFCGRRSGAWLAFLLPLLALLGCGESLQLGQPPNVYRDAGSYPADDVPPSARTAAPTIFYVTDRAPVRTPSGTVGYGAGRSSSMAFGTAKVAFGSGTSWEELVRASVQETAAPGLGLRVGALEEIVRFPSTPLPFTAKNGKVYVLAEARREYQARTRAFQRRIAQEINRTGRREVVVLVHGFNTSFTDSAAAPALIWHFSGRVGVPVLYAWPAGNSGLFGYFKDRESGEFSVFHLKEFLRILAAIPEVEKIHLIAHSRGTDVASTALREMMIAERAAGRSPRRTLKVANLILAAPDLDFGIARQRLIAEQFAVAFGQITVYLNPGDNALGLAQALLTGVRFGRITYDDLGENEKEIFRRIRNVNFVNVEDATRSAGHSYFRKNPDVLSDIVLTIRTGARPGTPERPLENVEGNFWIMRKGYPFAPPEQTAARSDDN